MTRRMRDETPQNPLRIVIAKRWGEVLLDAERSLSLDDELGGSNDMAWHQRAVPVSGEVAGEGRVGRC